MNMINTNSTEKLLLSDKLNNRLQKGNVHFTYTKKNGEQRHAYGTKNMKYVEENFGSENLPSGNGSNKEGVLPYFDLDKQAWRSCLIESIVSIDD